MLRAKGIAVDARDPEALAGFRQSALGYERRDLWNPYVGLRDPTGQGPLLTFQQVEKRVSNHLHLDLYADDPDSEAARLVELGARRIRQHAEGDVWWLVLEDPEGNEFCVIASQGPDREV